MKNKMLKILIPAVMLVFLVGGVIAIAGNNITKVDTQNVRPKIDKCSTCSNSFSNSAVNLSYSDLTHEIEKN